METLEEYVLTIDQEEHRQALMAVLDWVKESFPQLDFRIAWKQPMFTDHGTFIIGFSVSKKHIAIAPEAKAIQVFASKIEEAGYSHGSNLFRVLWKDTVPYPLLKEIIQYNIEDKKTCSSFWRIS